MLPYKFIQEAQSSILMIDSSGQEMLNSIANAIYKGVFNPIPIEETILSTRGEIFCMQDDDQLRNPFDEWQMGSIAIIPLSGVMFKESYWWGYGVDDIANIIRLAYQSEKISAIILKTNTPGGSTDSLYLIQEVLSEKIKPTYGYIDGMCASCGYVTLSYMDKIYAINEMANVGSIGVYARMIVPNKENSSYIIKEVYPDESKDKNLSARELIKGNEKPMKEELSKLAQYIQKTIKENRKEINKDTMTGGLYYAYEAEQLGMIDGIRTLSQVVSELESLVEKRKDLLLNI